MERIKEWAVLLLFLSAGSLIYCFLLPSGNVSKTVKAVISIVSLSFVCMPLFGIKDFFEKPLLEEESVSEYSYFHYLERSAEKEVNSLIADTVNKYTHVSYKTEISIDITKDNCIHIEYVGIIFSSEPDRKKELREALYVTLGIMPDIKVESVHE